MIFDPEGVSLRTKTIVELRTLHKQTTWLLKKLTSREWVRSDHLMTASEQAYTVSNMLEMLSCGIDPRDDLTERERNDLK